MQSKVIRKELAIIKQLKTQPFITLLLPFDPKMTPKYILENRLKSTIEKIKNELYENYSFVSAKEVLDKLAVIVCNLDYNTHKKSVAILASSDEQKVFYLDVPVEEKSFINNSFQIRQLVHHKKDEKEFLLVVLDPNFTAIYRGQGETISKILHKVPEYRRPGAKLFIGHTEKSSTEKKALLHKFLESTDKSLSIILNAFFLPVFVLGSESTLAVYKQISQHKDVIAGYVEGGFGKDTEDEIEKSIEPLLRKWRDIKEQFYKQQLERALEVGQLEVGIEGVWNLANRKNIKLLIVEEGYEFQAYLGKGVILCAEEAINNAYIKDVVEDIIEKVLADGGNVAFVTNGFLHDFMHIAAVKNF